MGTIATSLPEEVISARDGLLAFAQQEVMPRHERHRELLENPRAMYRSDGRFTDEVIGVIQEVRIASARAGFYQMCVPERLGGGGLAHLGQKDMDHQCPDCRLLGVICGNRQGTGTAKQRRHKCLHGTYCY